MSALVPIHPEPVPGDEHALRWVVPAGVLTFVGAVAEVPAQLRALLDDGTVASVVVEPAAVLISLAPGFTWRREGARVRTALTEGLTHPEQWRPALAGTADDVLRSAAETVLGGEVGEYIRSHGGVISLTDVDDGAVVVELNGSCAHCPASDMTLTGRFETAVRELYPALRGVSARRPEPVGPRRQLGLIPLRRR